MGPLDLISCQRKNPETNSGEGSCWQSDCFLPWMRAGIPPSSPTATSLPGVEFMPAHRPRLGLPLGLENPVPLQLKRRPPGMGILTTPLHRRWDCWSTKKVLITYVVQGLPNMAVTHKLSYHHFSHTEVGLSGVASVLGCCTLSFSLCKDFNTLSRGCLGSLWYWIFRLTGSWLGGIYWVKLVGENKKKLTGDLEIAARHNSLWST